MSNLLADQRQASLASALAHHHAQALESSSARRASASHLLELADRLSLRLSLWLAWQSARRLERHLDRAEHARLLRNAHERRSREHSWQRDQLRLPR